MLYLQNDAFSTKLACYAPILCLYFFLASLSEFQLLFIFQMAHGGAKQTTVPSQISTPKRDSFGLSGPSAPWPFPFGRAVAWLFGVVLLLESSLWHLALQPFGPCPPLGPLALGPFCSLALWPLGPFGPLALTLLALWVALWPFGSLAFWPFGPLALWPLVGLWPSLAL